ncbi:unnamed protein product [Medioppia subpectinata]|uniref:Uncharacterized protein n=1 Tax=Medioppia subpectinata TaxID=1979941 RepID=A0A7R9KF60_9ACAR|nr:unnamed protein product [Medioppia subpectinata]CAG2102216.1 unnamed protein product [Medioppia subpectinata]
MCTSAVFTERYQEFGGAIMDAMDDQLITSCKNTINADVYQCEQGIRWDQYPDATTDEGNAKTTSSYKELECILTVKLYEIHKCTADESIAVQKYYNGQIITNNQHNCVSYPYVKPTVRTVDSAVGRLLLVDEQHVIITKIAKIGIESDRIIIDAIDSQFTRIH